MQHNSGFQQRVGHADTVEALQASFISSKSAQRRKHVSSFLALSSAAFRGGNPASSTSSNTAPSCLAGSLVALRHQRRIYTCVVNNWGS